MEHFETVVLTLRVIGKAVPGHGQGIAELPGDLPRGRSGEHRADGAVEVQEQMAGGCGDVVQAAAGHCGRSMPTVAHMLSN